MKKTCLLLVCMLCIGMGAMAQTMTIDELTDKGVERHDKGDYIGALTYFRQALTKDSTAARVNYEMANTYVSMDKYEDAYRYADKVIKKNSQFVDMAYTLKGTALDMMKRPDEALEVYLEGLKKYPDNYLLRYNTAFIYLNKKEYGIAEYQCSRAITSNMHHASSHLIMAYAMYYQNKKSQSLMSLYYFLLLEPKSARSASALKLLQKQMAEGVTKEGANNINITVAADDKNEFGAADMLVSVNRALRYDDKSKGKTEAELFYDDSKLFLEVIGELKPKKKEKSVWWDAYVPFFRMLCKEKYTEPFCYYISQSAHDAVTDKWLANNKARVDQLLKWYDKQ